MLIHYKRHLRSTVNSSDKFSILSEDCTQFQSNSGNDYNFSSLNGHSASKDFNNLEVETPICINIIKQSFVDSLFQDEGMIVRDCYEDKNINISIQESHNFLFDDIGDDVDEYIFE